MLTSSRGSVAVRSRWERDDLAVVEFIVLEEDLDKLTIGERYKTTR